MHFFTRRPTQAKSRRKRATTRRQRLPLLEKLEGRALLALTFGTPENLGPAVNSAQIEEGPTITANGLGLLFASDRSGMNREVFEATRNSINEPFANVVSAGSDVNSSGAANHPAVSQDGLTLLFSSTGSPQRIYQATRSSWNAPFGSVESIGDLLGPASLESPSVSSDGLTLYFTGWDAAHRVNDIYQATRQSIADPWENVAMLGPAVNGSFNDAMPSISADGLMLFFNSNRPGGFGAFDLYVSIRATRNSPWENAVNLGSAVNTPYDDKGANVSADGTLLYFNSNRPGGFGLDDLYEVAILESVGPSISIDDVNVSEGPNAQASFIVRLSVPSTSPVTVNFATADGTALAGLDYVTTSGTLTFEPGQTRRTILAPILDDTGFEPTETFHVNLSSAVGATISDATATGTILDNDTELQLTLRASDDGQVLELHLFNPPIPGEPPVFTWPMNSKTPLEIDTDFGDSDDALFVELPAASEGPLGGIVLDTGLGTNRLIVNSGRVRIDSVSTGGTLKTTVAAGAELLTSQLQQNDVTVDGRLTLLPGGQTSKVTGLMLGVGGILDLGDNALVVDYSGTSPLTAIREKIRSGRGGTGFGASWTGTGINSSAAAQANAADPEARSVGFAENAALPLGPYTTFRGQPVDDTAVLIAYTRTGDANLNGVVDDQDVTIVGATYAPSIPQPHWTLGDFDYNGFVDDADATLLGVFYDPSVTPLAAPVGWAVPTARAAWAEAAEAPTVAISLRTEREDYDHALAAPEDYGAYALAIEQLYAEYETTWKSRSRFKFLA